jgi:formamidopyrimidine-DNA glycosylase
VLLDRTIAHPFCAADFLAAVPQYEIHQWHRRGKYLLAELRRPAVAEPAWLGVHLRMTGQLLWLWPTAPLEKHCRVRLWFEGDRELRFVDQRTFGRLWWVPPGTDPATIITGLQRLGPDPFTPDFSVDYIARWLRDRHRPIKNTLLDQQFVAGIGNIYADEALFLSGIHPTTDSAALTSAQHQRLHQTILTVLQDGITAGGTTINTFRHLDGVNGNYGGAAWVYGRTGDRCRVCGTEIQRLKLAGRSAHFCPRCQPPI